jgi:glycosyltransferase involved in cell wall biosynthesis
MKILLLTPNFKSQNESGPVTSIVNDYAYQLSKNNDVFVVHHPSSFPFLVTKIIHLFHATLVNLFSGIPNTNNLSNKEYSINFKVFRKPIRKIFPRVIFSKFTINRYFNSILNELDQTSFVPEIIIGHWNEPTIRLVNLLGRHFKSKTSIIMHNFEYLEHVPISSILSSIDVIGFRSPWLLNKFNLKFPKYHFIKTFIAFSGIPTFFFDQKHPLLLPLERNNTILFIGMMINRKNPRLVLDFFSNHLNKNPASLIMIGDGKLKKSLVKKYKKHHNIRFIDFIPKKELVNYYSNSCFFLLPSINETYGLVYLEAMSRGSIPIATKESGINGIIIHGYNGFLLDKPNLVNLVNLFKLINALTTNQLIEIQKNSIKTAENYTLENAANNYIKGVKL